MPDWLAFLVTIFAGAAAVFGYLVWQRIGDSRANDKSTSERSVNEKGLSRDDVAQVLREEIERVRRAGDDQMRSLRQELGDNLRGSQETMLSVFRELGQSLGHQSRRSGEQLSDALRAIETRLDAAISRQSSELAAVRQELAAEGRRITDALLNSMVELRAAQAAEAEVLARRLSDNLPLAEKNLASLKEALRATASELDAAGDRRQRALAEAIGVKFGHLGDPGAGPAALRDELSAGLQRLDSRITESFSHLGVQQVNRLEQVAQSLRGLIESHAGGQEALRKALDASLEAIRRENASKLEDVKRLKELEAENARLRRAIADLTLDKITLNEALKGKS